MCTSTSIQLSWTNSITHCITDYNIHIGTPSDPIITTTSDTSHELPVSSLLAGGYTVSVAGNDTGGRTGPSSNTVSFTIDGEYNTVRSV